MFDGIINKCSSFLEPISEISKADDKPKFIESDFKLINFDKVAKQFGDVFRSPDALWFKKNNIVFIEFKDRKISCVKVNDKCSRNKIQKGVKGKIYEGISLLSYLLDDPVESINIEWYLVCNPKLNIINNPVHSVIQDIVARESSSDIDNLRTKSIRKTLEKCFLPLSKININIKFEIILSEDKLNGFITNIEQSP